MQDGARKIPQSYIALSWLSALLPTQLLSLVVPLQIALSMGYVHLAASYSPHARTITTPMPGEHPPRSSLGVGPASYNRYGSSPSASMI